MQPLRISLQPFSAEVVALLQQLTGSRDTQTGAVIRAMSLLKDNKVKGSKAQRLDIVHL